MAHFAKLGINGKVIAVHGVDDDRMLNADNIEDETVGQQYLEHIFGWPAPMWIQCSYNTKANQHLLGGTPFRGNYPGIGWTWDEDNQIFWAKQPHASWNKNIATASWEAPISYPSIIDDGVDPNVWSYQIWWDEEAYQSDNNTGWKADKTNDTNNPKTVYSWNGSAWV